MALLRSVLATRTTRMWARCGNFPWRTLLGEVIVYQIMLHCVNIIADDHFNARVFFHHKFVIGNAAEFSAIEQNDIHSLRKLSIDQWTF